MTARTLTAFALLAGLGCGSSDVELSQNAIDLALVNQSSGVHPDLRIASIIEDALQRADDALEVADSKTSAACFYVTPKFFFDRFVLHGVEEPAYSNWINGELLSGDAELDAIVDEFQLDSVTYLANLSSDTFHIELKSNLRTDRLIEQISDTTSVVAGSVELVDGGSSNIEIAETSQGTEILFWQGWNACESGCLGNHYWRVLVPTNPEAAPSLLEEYGDPRPASLTNCP